MASVLYPSEFLCQTPGTCRTRAQRGTPITEWLGAGDQQRAWCPQCGTEYVAIEARAWAVAATGRTREVPEHRQDSEVP